MGGLACGGRVSGLSHDDAASDFPSDVEDAVAADDAADTGVSESEGAEANDATASDSAVAVGPPDATASDSAVAVGPPDAGSVGDSSASASDAKSDADQRADGGCSPGNQECVGTSIATCDANGQWSFPWPCATGACSGGACTGSTPGTSTPSCQPGGAGMTDCGAASESCCVSLEVPGGTYYRTYVNQGSGPTGELDPATVSGFRLDKYLVTVGRFRQFVNAWSNGAGYLPAAGSGVHVHLNGGRGLVNAVADAGVTYETGWLTSDNANVAPSDLNLACGITPAWATWTDSPGSYENVPINCISWQDAYAFCIWDGGFLPSESEWEYAAAGGNQQREYPWGSADPGTANAYAIYGCYYRGSGTCSGATNIAPVGTSTLGAGLWGQLDLAGTLQEWTLDWGEGAYVSPCSDCASLTSASGERSFRGGDFEAVYTFDIVPTLRDYSPPWELSSAAGFRCARTP